MFGHRNGTLVPKECVLRTASSQYADWQSGMTNFNVPMFDGFASDDTVDRAAKFNSPWTRYFLAIRIS